jgi:hypothetical protein
MRWFRSNRRFVARLALFALGLQLALTFGHIHREDLIPAAAASTLVASSVQQPAAAPSLPAPADKKSRGAIDDVCAICALIQLANISVTSTAPLLPLPAAVGWSRFELTAEAFLAPSPRRLFGARAPPLA